MQQSLTPGSNPESAITIPQNHIGLERSRQVRDRNFFGVAISELLNSAPCEDKHAVWCRAQHLQGVNSIRNCVEFLRSWQPAPGCAGHGRPKTAILIPPNCQNSFGKIVHAIVAVSTSAPDRAQKSISTQTPSYPEGSCSILEQGVDEVTVDFRISGQFSSIPAGEPLVGPEPKCPIAGGKQDAYLSVRQRRRGLPWDVPHPIEA